MDAPSTSRPTSPSGNAEVVNVSPHQACPLQSLDTLRTPVVARRRVMKAGAFGSPVRRSPRLSGLPPPQPPIVFQDTQNSDESSEDDLESVTDVVFQLSREETPENDPLPPDEPSTVLANKIMRAHDNPSPPPQDLARSSIGYVPGKDRQFLPFGVSPPPSPFRPINLFEQLGQPSQPSFDPSRSLQNLTLSDPAELPESGIVPPACLISPRFCLPSVACVLTKGAPHEDLAFAHAVPSSSTQLTIDGLPSHSPEHAHEPTDLLDDAGMDASSLPGPYGQSTSLDPEVFRASSTQTADSSSNPVIPSPQDTKTMIPRTEDKTEKGVFFVQNSSFSVLEEQESKCRETLKEANDDQHQRLGSLSLHSTPVLGGLCFPSDSTSSVEEISLPAESVHMKPTSTIPVTPPGTPKPSAARPNFSQSTIQRPVIPSTPARANNVALKSNSPFKFSSEAHDMCRTPAQRVPVETVLTRGTPFQRTVYTGPDQSQLGRFLPIRTPVFKRPALDDPSRSPAKRVPVTDINGSPIKGDQSQTSPTRLDLRARSASVEPRSIESIPPRSRSVEPSSVTSKAVDHGIIKESIAPMVPILPRSGVRLPFPLVTGEKPNSDLPSPIAEESENVENRTTEIDTTLYTVAEDKKTSQLRQPSVTSRIPRIGNKPYARPLPKGPKATACTAIANASRASNILPFQTACGVGKSNLDVASAECTSDQRSSGLLKRKRGAEAAAPSNSHPIMIRQVVPGILNEKYAPKLAKFPGQMQTPLEPSPPKAPQPLKFRKVVDGMLSARYASATTNLSRPESSNPPIPLSPLSELSSSSNEDLANEKLSSNTHFPARPKSETSDTPLVDSDAPIVGPSTQESSLHQDADSVKPSSRRPRRTSRSRKPAQQQYVLDIFNGNASTRAPAPRRKPQSRTSEGDGFMGMSATALKALTTSNTTKNQQTVTVLATEVIRKEGLRPESPTVKARTILQKQQDERDRRRRERAQRRARMSEEASGASDTEGQPELGTRLPLCAREVHDENDAIPQNHRRGPGDDEDYETPERPERTIEPLRFEGVDRTVKQVKQVKWHRGLSTAVYLDEVDPKPTSLPKNVIVVRGCLAPTSKNLPLDSLGNLVDIDSRPFPELLTEQIVVKKYLYDNDIEPEPVAPKVTRSRSKRSRS